MLQIPIPLLPELALRIARHIMFFTSAALWKGVKWRDNSTETYGNKQPRNYKVAEYQKIPKEEPLKLV